MSSALQLLTNKWTSIKTLMNFDTVIKEINQNPYCRVSLGNKKSRYRVIGKGFFCCLVN